MTRASAEVGCSLRPIWQAVSTRAEAARGGGAGAAGGLSLAHPRLPITSGERCQARSRGWGGGGSSLGGGSYAPVGKGPRRTTYEPPGPSLDPYKRKSHKYLEEVNYCSETTEISDFMVLYSALIHPIVIGIPSFAVLNLALGYHF